MKQDKFFFNTLLIIVPLYFLQGWLFDHGSLISQGIAAIWLLIDLVYLYKYNNSKIWEPIGRSFALFWLLNTITWLLAPFFASYSNHTVGWIGTYSVYKNISLVFLTYFPFYYFSYKKSIGEKQLKKLVLLSLICLVAAFFISARESAYNLGRDEVTNNGSYYLVVIIPLIGLFFDKFIEYIFIGGILVLVLIGAKRGALLCAAVEFFLFLYFYSKSTRISRSPIRYVWLVIAVSIIVYIGKDIFQGTDYLQQRYDQTISGDSSLRDEIYSMAFYKFLNQNLFQQLFGNGMSSTLSILGGYAHQDWLELLINNGLLGVILYLFIFINLLSYYRKVHKGLTPMECFILLSATLGWILRSLYSMGYYSVETSFYVMAIGYVCSHHRKIKKVKVL